MKIRSEDFRVREGDKVDLQKVPTHVKPAYKSRKEYKKLLEDHVEQLSSLQQLLYASNRHADPADLSGDGRGWKGRRDHGM